MKFTFYVEQYPKPIVITTTDKNLKNAKLSMDKVMKHNLTVAVSSDMECLLIRGSKINGVFLSCDQLDNLSIDDSIHVDDTIDNMIEEEVIIEEPSLLIDESVTVLNDNSITVETGPSILIEDGK